VCPVKDVGQTKQLWRHRINDGRGRCVCLACGVAEPTDSELPEWAQCPQVNGRGYCELHAIAVIMHMARDAATAEALGLRQESVVVRDSTLTRLGFSFTRCSRRQLHETFVAKAAAAAAAAAGAGAGAGAVSVDGDGDGDVDGVERPMRQHGTPARLTQHSLRTVRRPLEPCYEDNLADTVSRKLTFAAEAE
jgi:hypothetical protein